MEDINRICSKYDVEKPSSLFKRVKYYSMAALDNTGELRERWGRHDKAPDLQLMDLLLSIKNISEKIEYLKVLKDLLPTENTHSIFGGLSTNVNNSTYKQFLEFVDKEFRELQELRFKGLKNVSATDKQSFTDDQLKRIAIHNVAESVDYSNLAKKTLSGYVEFKKLDRKRSALNIYQEDLENEFPKLKQSTFLKWEKKYRDELKALRYAQEN
jgi:hypothetical protein